MEPKVETLSEYMWFRLWRTKGIGPKAIAFTYHYFHNQGKSIIDMANSTLAKLTATFPELVGPILSKMKPEEKGILRKEYEMIKNAGLTIIHPESEHYPNNYLNYVEQIGLPPLFFCKGNISLLKKSGVSIVGSRNVSQEGIEITRKITATLTQNGRNIISGYAKGVDTMAHMGALEARGTTTLVLSYGINEFKIKRELQNLDLGSRALLVTQFMPDETWKARNAMTRNKLICALSDSVIVIESGPERDEKGIMSGTFDSAKNAIKMGKKLFVLSPTLFNAIPQGNVDLLKIGGQEVFPNTIVGDMMSSSTPLFLTPPTRIKKERPGQLKLDFKPQHNLPLHPSP